MSVRRALVAFVLLVSVGALAAPPLVAQGRITSPKEEFGANFGDDYFLANYQQIAAYWHKLEKESPRIKVQAIGKTAEGREHLMAIRRAHSRTRERPSSGLMAACTRPKHSARSSSVRPCIRW